MQTQHFCLYFQVTLLTPHIFTIYFPLPLSAQQTAAAKSYSKASNCQIINIKATLIALQFLKRLHQWMIKKLQFNYDLTALPVTVNLLLPGNTLLSSQSLSFSIYLKQYSIWLYHILHSFQKILLIAMLHTNVQAHSHRICTKHFTSLSFVQHSIWQEPI